MILRDTENFPGDDHGFATDGVYGYRLRHLGGYKVWRLQSDPAVSNIIFNGDGTGTCGGSGTQCSITPTGIGNATYMGYDLSSNRYIVGDWAGTKFYMTESANPGVGPGTAPVTVSSFSSAVTSPTTSPSPNYTLTFNTAVTGVTSADFTNTGSASCTFAVSAVSTTVYTVTPTCGDGTVRPQFAANGAILASNGTSTGPAFAAAASTTVTVGIPPTVTAFTSTTANGSYRATQTINITATMSEAIRSGNSFVVTLNTGATVTMNAAAAGTTLTGTYTVAASQTTSDLTVSSYTVGTVLDTAGNAMTSTTLPAGANIADTSDIAIDTTAPSVVSFTSAQSSPTNATSFTYTITFSEAVTGIAAGDFSNTGTALSCVFDPGTDTASTTRTVTITGCGAGTLTPRFVINGAVDNPGNTGPSAASTSGTTITIDRTAPTISSFSSTTADGSYTTGQSVNVTATVSESIRSGSSITVTLDTGATVSLTAASAGTTMTGTYTIVTGQNSADLTVSSYTYSAGTVLDTAGNAMTSTDVPTGTNNIAGADAIVIDTTGPAAPTSLTATATATTATITFTPGVGGPSAVTNYKYSLNGGAFTALSPADSTSPITISGLTTGVAYTIILRTVTAIGDSASSASVTITPSNIAGLATVAYTEQDPATNIASNVNFSGGTSYDGKYIDFAIGSPQATEILGYTTSGTATTTNGVVSIVGTSVYLGNGTSADPIGSVDSTRNGQNGQPLRINFTSSFSNNSFETGDLTGWTYLDQQIDLGVTSIASRTTSDTSTYPARCSNDSNDHAVTGLGAGSFDYELITSSVGGSPGTTDGTRALRLFSSMSLSTNGYV
ncbi:MAG: hypothetical protein FGM42_08600, partial [Ilumatobacteraceae bacterium]|nr:hypothetical protein [Ilumatobacteraceae bacterium]